MTRLAVVMLLAGCALEQRPSHWKADIEPEAFWKDWSGCVSGATVQQAAWAAIRATVPSTHRRGQ